MEKANLAFRKLESYFRSKEVWFAPKTCESISEVITRIDLILMDYIPSIAVQGYAVDRETEDAAYGIVRTIEELRKELIAEFRAIS